MRRHDWIILNDNTISGNFTRELLLGTDADETIDGAGSSDIVDGSGGNDSIKGGDASVRDQWTGNHDILIGGERRRHHRPGRRQRHSDGGRGRRHLRVPGGHGTDKITDFTDGEDLIDVSALGITKISGLTFSTNASGNLVINTGDGNGTIELEGVTDLGTLTEEDFIFAPPTEDMSGDSSEACRRASATRTESQPGPGCGSLAVGRSAGDHRGRRRGSRRFPSLRSSRKRSAARHGKPGSQVKPSPASRSRYSPYRFPRRRWPSAASSSRPIQPF